LMALCCFIKGVSAEAIFLICKCDNMLMCANAPEPLTGYEISTSAN